MTVPHASGLLGVRQRAIAVGVAVGALAILLLPGCAADAEGDAADEAEDPIAAPGQEEQVSLGELQDEVRQRAEESGLGADVLECVYDYLAENFDDELSSGDAAAAIDEGFGACTVTAPLPGPGEDPAG